MPPLISQPAASAAVSTAAACMQVNPQDSPERRLLRPKVLTAADVLRPLLLSQQLLRMRLLSLRVCAGEPPRLPRAAPVAA
jgi:hypothetical protein